MGKLTEHTTSVWNESKIKEGNIDLKAKFIAYLKPDKLGWNIWVVNALIFALIFFLTHIFLFFPQLKPCINAPFEETNHLQNLFTLHAAVTALIFPMVFFIAEKLRSTDKDEGRVLIRESSFWHIIFFGTALFLNLVIAGDDIWRVAAYAVHFLYILLVLNSIRSIINILLNPMEMDKRTQQLYTQRMNRYNDELISLRIANNNFAGYLKQNTNTDFSFFNDDKEVVFKSEKFGTITDINLKSLHKLINKVKKLSSQKEKLSDSSTASQEPKPVEKKQPKPEIKVSRLIGHKVTQEHSNLLTITGIDEKDSKEVNQLVQQIFTIHETKSFDEELAVELGAIRDDLIQSIRSNSQSRIKTKLDQIEKVTASFLEALNKINSNYSAEDAKQERGSLFERWNQIEFVTDILDDALQESLTTNNQKIVKEIIYFPFRLSRLAIKYNDHLVFQTFIGYISRIYFLGNNRDIDKSVKEFIFDRSFRHLSEFANYVLVPDAEKQVDDADLSNYYSYFQSIAKVFVNLMKSAYDAKNEKHFARFATELNKIAKYFESRSYRNHYDDSDTDIDSKLKLKKHIEESKQDIFFGFASFILRDFMSSKDEKLKPYIQKLESLLPNDIKEFTEIFIRVHNFDMGEVWGWDWWHMREDEEHFSKIETLPNLEKFYAVRGLALVGHLDQNYLERIDMPTNRDLYYLTEGTRDLLNFLNDVKQNPTTYSYLVAEITGDKVDKFIFLLEKAKKKQVELDKNTIINSSLDEDKVTEFIKDFKDGYNRHTVLRSIFAAHNKIEDKTDTYVKLPEARGVNQIEEKEAFIKDWHVHYAELGEHFGINMAHFQNQKLLSFVKGKSQKLTIAELLETEENPTDLIAILVGSNLYELKEMYEGNKLVNLFSSWEVDTSSLESNLQKLLGEHIDGFIEIKGVKVPIVIIDGERDAPELIIIKPSSLGSAVQHKPLESVDTSSLVEGIFSLEIIDIAKDEQLMKEFLKKKPDWLKKEPNPEDYLKQKVIIKIFEKLSYKECGNEMVFLIELPKQS